MNNFIYPDIQKVEEAYQLIAQEIISFIDGRPWHEAVAQYGIFPKSVSSTWWRKNDNELDKTGNFPPNKVSAAATNAVYFLRDSLLKATGDRIWGLTFTLYPEGKFKLAYDYTKPDGYEETEG